MNNKQFNNSIMQVTEAQCTGCGACYNKCPFGAIKMNENRKGFLEPVINEELCTNCGLCAKTCPALNKTVFEKYRSEEPDCYAIMANTETRKSSSSGGMFTILANYVLDKGGVVCGAAFTDDYRGVNHIIINDRKDLQRIRGSKYLQSDTETTYKAVEEHLKNGKWVLYSGTGCQVAAMRNFLKKDYDNLIIVDILCHGVPSPKAYRKYIDEKRRGRKLVRTDFREKAHFGWGSASSLFFEDGSVYRGNCFKDEYWRAFLGGLSTRECCSSCPYASMHRIGDFSLGDFWGVKEIDESYDDGKGTSIVFANNEKAKNLLKTLENKCSLIKKVDMDKVAEIAKTRNGRLLSPTPRHWASERFFWLLDMKPFTEAFDFAVNSKYDVGITGWWYNDNYGGTLTYFALNRVIRSMGLTVLMIDRCTNDPNFKPNYDKMPYRFALKNYNISKNYTHNTIGILNEHCNAFVSGSDQLFNPVLWPWSGPQYFLNYVHKRNKIISYASSFGNGFHDPKNLRASMGYWLHRFDAISVRESYGVDILRDHFGIEGLQVMDPVFLCDVNEYEKLAESSGLKKDKDYMVSFFLDPDEAKRSTILSLSKKLGLPYVNLLNADHIQENVDKLHLDNMKPDCDLEEWLFHYKNADFIITDSFHGTCFAIIFRKKFISVANQARGANRFVSVLEEAGLMDRLVWDLSEIDNRPELFEDIDYDKVYERLNPKIHDSFKWLENALKSPKSNDATVFNSLNFEIERIKDELNGVRHELNQVRGQLDNVSSGEAAKPEPVKSELKNPEHFSAELPKNDTKLIKSLKKFYKKHIK